MRTSILALAAAAALAAACHGRRTTAGLSAAVPDRTAVIVPSANAAVRGDTALRTIDTNNARTYMLGIGADQLAAIPLGAMLNGLSFRASVFRLNEDPWPAQPFTFDAFWIELGPAKPMSTWQKKFADNYESAPSLVRQGPLTIPAETFHNDADLAPPQPNPWGEFFWDFKRPYRYEGGDLAVRITHLGGSGGLPIFFDAVESKPTDGLVAYAASTFNAENGTRSAFTVLRFHYGYGTGCPGSNGAVMNLVLGQARSDAGDLKATLKLSGGVVNAPAALALGLDRTEIPLAGGCLLLTTPAIVLPAPLDAAGRFSAELTVPPGDDQLRMQAVALDPGAPSGYALSNGVEIRG